MKNHDKRQLDVDYLRSRVRYDKDTGELFWKGYKLDSGRWSRLDPDRPAFNCNGPKGYAVGNIDRQSLYAHRVAWAIHYGQWPSGQIDHIDGNKRNNRIDNLRDVKAAENCRNLPLQANNTSGTPGVYWNARKGVWYAAIGLNRRSKHLGTFIEKADAVAARKAADALYGFHENHGRSRVGQA